MLKNPTAKKFQTFEETGVKLNIIITEDDKIFCLKKKPTNEIEMAIRMTIPVKGTQKRKPHIIIIKAQW